jgi:hypothetical protein
LADSLDVMDGLGVLVGPSVADADGVKEAILLTLGLCVGETDTAGATGVADTDGVGDALTSTGTVTKPRAVMGSSSPRAPMVSLSPS